MLGKIIQQQIKLSNVFKFYFRDNQKYIHVINLPFAEFAQTVVKVKIKTTQSDYTLNYVKFNNCSDTVMSVVYSAVPSDDIHSRVQ